MKQLFFFISCMFVTGLIFYQIGHRNASRQTQIVTDIEYIHHYDTIVNEIPVPSITVKEVPAAVDTAAILAAYFQEVRYNDTIQGSSVSLHIQDVISQNRLIDRVITFDERVPVVRHNALLLSAAVGRQSCSLLAGIRHKTLSYQAGYDFHNKAWMVAITKEVLKW